MVLQKAAIVLGMSICMLTGQLRSALNPEATVVNAGEVVESVDPVKEEPKEDTKPVTEEPKEEKTENTEEKKENKENKKEDKKTGQSAEATAKEENKQTGQSTETTKKETEKETEKKSVQEGKEEQKNQAEEKTELTDKEIESLIVKLKEKGLVLTKDEVKNLVADIRKEKTDLTGQKVKDLIEEVIEEQEKLTKDTLKDLVIEKAKNNGEETPGGDDQTGETPGGDDQTGETPGEDGDTSSDTVPDEGKPETPDGMEPGTSGGNESNAQGTGAGETAVSGEPGGKNKTSEKKIALRKAKKASKYLENRHEKTNMFEGFVPSEQFISIANRQKYSTEVPIEGLPSFITQEMVVGALKCQDENGYPASVTIAQIIQESGFGKYGPNGEQGQGLSYLAYEYNNLFGIKGTGTVGSVSMRTGEQRADGSRYNITAAFRAYHTYTECMEDRAELLKSSYSDLTLGVTDANTFAMKIGQRWATSLNYGHNLISQMERYDLYRLDEMTLGDFSSMLGIFANPCPGASITSGFGEREAPTSGASTYHKGLDLGTGTFHIPTYAAASGIVTFAGSNGGAGNMITIDHGNGLVTKYMHHSQIYVSAGDTVEKGQQIGLTGSTGVSTGNHLHFQVEKNGIALDPEVYFAEPDGDID